MSWLVFQLVVYFGNWDSNKSKILQIFGNYVKFGVAMPILLIISMFTGIFLTLFVIFLMKWRSSEYWDDMNF